MTATKFIIKTKQDNMYHGNIRDLIDHLNVMRYNECLHDIVSIETQQSDKMCVCKQCCDIIKFQRELFMVNQLTVFTIVPIIAITVSKAVLKNYSIFNFN